LQSFAASNDIRVVIAIDTEPEYSGSNPASVS